jgi:translation initiation factor 2 alpha subunit (eIF-2alpha)
MVYYYKSKFPSIDDVVIAKVINISEYGIEVKLIEYNDIKGFINCGEVSRKKKVNFNKLLTINKDILVHVMQVDETNCMIDLSKRTMGDEDVKQFTDTHKSHMQLYNLFKQLYMKINNINELNKINQEELHEFMCETLFELQTEFENDYLIEKITNKETNNEIIESIDFESLPNPNITVDLFKKTLDEYIDKKINRVKPELTETVKLMTYGVLGLADIKYTLDFKSFDEFTELDKDFDIKINYISSSVYSIILNQKEFDLTTQYSIEEAILVLKKEIKKRAMEKGIQNQVVL